MNKILSSGLVLSAMLSLVGCGGGSSSSDTTTTTTTTTSFGKFIDAPVKGLHYTSATHQGYTDENGIFEYVKGEKVTFSLGNIEIGTAQGELLVSPHDIAQESGNTNDTAANIAVFLQNLDVNKSDKGTIDVSNLKNFTFANAEAIDFSDPTLDIVTKVTEILDPVVNPGVETLVDNNTTIIDKETAVLNMNTYVEEAEANIDAWAAEAEALTATGPVVTDPVVTDPIVTDPVVTDPVVTDPIVTDPVVTDTNVTDPVVTDPIIIDPVVTDPIITDPVVTDPIVTDPVVTDPVVTDPSIISLLAGNTFYNIGSDNIGEDWIDRIEFNVDATSLVWTSLTTGESGTHTTLIEGDTITINGDTGDFVLTFIVDAPDMLVFHKLDANGFVIEEDLMYFDQAAAQAYYDSLQSTTTITDPVPTDPIVTNPTAITQTMLTGKTFYEQDYETDFNNVKITDIYGKMTLENGVLTRTEIYVDVATQAETVFGPFTLNYTLENGKIKIDLTAFGEGYGFFTLNAESTDAWTLTMEDDRNPQDGVIDAGTARQTTWFLSKPVEFPVNFPTDPVTPPSIEVGAALTTFVSGNTFAFDEESAIGTDITLTFGADGIYTDDDAAGDTCTGTWTVVTDTEISVAECGVTFEFIGEFVDGMPMIAHINDLQIIDLYGTITLQSTDTVTPLTTVPLTAEMLTGNVFYTDGIDNFEQISFISSSEVIFREILVDVDGIILFDSGTYAYPYAINTLGEVVIDFGGGYTNTYALIDTTSTQWNMIKNGEANTPYSTWLLNAPTNFPTDPIVTDPLPTDPVAYPGIDTTTPSSVNHLGDLATVPLYYNTVNGIASITFDATFNTYNLTLNSQIIGENLLVVSVKNNNTIELIHDGSSIKMMTITADYVDAIYILNGTETPFRMYYSPSAIPTAG